MSSLGSSIYKYLAKTFVSKFDAEFAHNVALKLLSISDPSYMTHLLSQAPLIGNSLDRLFFGPKSPTTCFGLEFRSPIGLAAGFDKNADALSILPLFGFSFSEIGTVTPRPQIGNPKPRLFRDFNKQIIYNRMGFNNDGAEAIAQNIERSRKRLPSWFRVGVNIGKNKDTPLENASSDYEFCARRLLPLCDFLVINVSSPNTPGLRSLQESSSLALILDSVLSVREKVSPKTPVLVKLAPEIQGDSLTELIQNIESNYPLNGWVLTNTLAQQYSIAQNQVPMGVSGTPLIEISRQSLIQARKISKLPLISSGGILDSSEAIGRINSGASLVEIYTGWIMQGPCFAKQLTKVMKPRLDLSSSSR